MGGVGGVEVIRDVKEPEITTGLSVVCSFYSRPGQKAAGKKYELSGDYSADAQSHRSVSQVFCAARHITPFFSCFLTGHKLIPYLLLFVNSKDI